MKKIYNISKTQLIIAWIFGIIFTLNFSGSCSNNYKTCSPTEVSVIVLVPFILFFYTAGWLDNRKMNSNKE